MYFTANLICPLSVRVVETPRRMLYSVGHRNKGLFLILKVQHNGNNSNSRANCAGNKTSALR